MTRNDERNQKTDETNIKINERFYEENEGRISNPTYMQNNTPAINISRSRENNEPNIGKD